jgi:hypothetical protein
MAYSDTHFCLKIYILPSCLWKKYVLLQLPFTMYDQGTRIRVEFGDSTTTIDSKCADIIAQAFPNIFGQKLVRFLEPHTDTVVSESDAQVIQEHPPIRLDLNS